MFNNVLCCFIFLLLRADFCPADEMSYIGLALEGFSPCPNGVLYMSREIGGPSNLENYWKGEVFLDKWRRLPEVRLRMTLDAPAQLEVDPDLARLSVQNRTFFITTFLTPPKIDKVLFIVRGRPHGKFPNILSLHLNDADICPNPGFFTPNLVGSVSVMESEDFTGFLGGGGEEEFCGRRKIKHEELITFGSETRPGDFPWHVAIYHQEGRQRSYKCGGTIINKNSVLTAAHCVTEGTSTMTAERIIVQVGKYHLNVADDSAKEFRVLSVQAHPEYDTSLLRNDIALLRLSREIRFTNHIQPICLYNNSVQQTMENHLGTAVGWGHTENDTVSDTLRHAEIPIVPTLTCLESDRDFFGGFLSETNFCAGYINGTNVCSGDSGGSLAFQDSYSKVWRIRGIVSLSIRRWDKEICNPKHYVLFTDVTKYLKWIQGEITRMITEN
ncbi:uncharacterized protein DMENIID0001_165330 [Sergentomyia squamirostris]